MRSHVSTSFHLSFTRSWHFGIHDLTFIALGGCLSPHVLRFDQDRMVLIFPHGWAGILLLAFSLLQKENLELAEAYFEHFSDLS